MACENVLEKNLNKDKEKPWRILDVDEFQKAVDRAIKERSKILVM